MAWGRTSRGGILALFVFLSGCATVPGPARPQEIAAIEPGHTISVCSQECYAPAAEGAVDKRVLDAKILGIFSGSASSERRFEVISSLYPPDKQRLVTIFLDCLERAYTMCEARPDVAMQVDVTAVARRRGGKDLLAMTSGTVLGEKDGFKLYFKTNQDGHVYILMLTAQGKVEQFLPGPWTQETTAVRGGVEYAAPPREGFFILDDAQGMETVYVLASKEPLKDIDDLLARMQRSADAEKGSEALVARLRGVSDVSDRTGSAGTSLVVDGKKVQVVTESVLGRVSAVRSISFKHE